MGKHIDQSINQIIQDGKTHGPSINQIIQDRKTHGPINKSKNLRWENTWTNQ